ncbi:hypothetical protein HF668_02475, partial [Acidithiobacillus ferridurans]|uniref:hypothetical protein n=1 Tax=Acidithiobacillus ferridurans TaxID=1232575 RepID=UPI001C06EC43
MSAITLSIATTANPERLSKAFSLDADGQLVKDQGGKMFAGSAAVRHVQLAGIPAILQALTPAQALIFGQPL